MVDTTSRPATGRLASKLTLALIVWACTGDVRRGAVASAADVSPPPPQLTFAESYNDGVQAYLEERWVDCVSSFERALATYKQVKEITVNCRMKCRRDAEEATPMFAEDVDGMQHGEGMVRKTLCLLKCNKVLFKDRQPVVEKEMARNFEQLKPYEYLQLCYFQRNMAQKASSAVFTFLVANPDHETMLTNLKFYTTLPEVNSDDIVNLEAPPFVGLYVHGSDAYKNEDFTAVINNIEESLVEYLHAEERCRAFCEGPFDQGWFPDYTSSVANHFTYCLKCKRKCPYQLNTLNGERHEDLLPSHYHYLQFAYFKVGKLQKACEAVASYLLFFPEDETMLENKAYYQTKPTVTAEFFTPRGEAYRYVKRQEYENALMSYIEKEFIFQEDSDNTVADSESLSSKHARGLLLQYKSLITKSSEIIKSILGQVKSHDESKSNSSSAKGTHVELHEIKDEIASRGNGAASEERSTQIVAGESSEGDAQTADRGASCAFKQAQQETDPLQSTSNHSEVISKCTAKEPSSTCTANTPAKEEPKPVEAVESSQSTTNTTATHETPPPVAQTCSRNVAAKLEGPKKEHVHTLAEKKIMNKLRKKTVLELQSSPYQGITLVKGVEQMTEDHRFMAEGFAQENECQAMLGLAKAAAVPGDGYAGKVSPHTNMEKFEGLSIGRVALMVHLGVLEPQLLDTFFDIGERGKTYIERYFNLKKKLYFNYTHLVCRTSLMTGTATDSTHLSHPIHADNCNTQYSGDCIKERPAYTWRDYSAVVYLNNNFKGGEFFFAKNVTDSNMQTRVKAKCGRMVGFSSGKENLHGVRGVVQGTRCAMGLWFTLDPAYNEVERVLAQHVREEVKKKGSVNEQMLRDLKSMTNFK